MIWLNSKHCDNKVVKKKAGQNFDTKNRKNLLQTFAKKMEIYSS